VHRFIGKRNGENVAIGIIFGATRIIFKFFDKRIRFPDPADAYMEKEVSPPNLPEGEEAETGLFMFQIDVF
jgi:hypothetical protein